MLAGSSELLPTSPPLPPPNTMGCDFYQDSEKRNDVLFIISAASKKLATQVLLSEGMGVRMSREGFVES